MIRAFAFGNGRLLRRVVVGTDFRLEGGQRLRYGRNQLFVHLDHVLNRLSVQADGQVFLQLIFNFACKLLRIVGNILIKDAVTGQLEHHFRTFHQVTFGRLRIEPALHVYG